MGKNVGPQKNGRQAEGKQGEGIMGDNTKGDKTMGAKMKGDKMEGEKLKRDKMKGWSGTKWQKQDEGMMVDPQRYNKQNHCCLIQGYIQQNRW